VEVAVSFSSSIFLSSFYDSVFALASILVGAQLGSEFVCGWMLILHREEEDPDEYPFPLTLRSRRSSAGGPTSPSEASEANGNGVEAAPKAKV
jgi:hypothetical protein